MSHYKPYPAYKDSGVEWIGRVPAHWEVLRLANVGPLVKGNGGTKADDADDGIPCIRYGDLYTTYDFVIRKIKKFILPESMSNYARIQFGDLLLAASGETFEEIGKSAVNLDERQAVCGGDVIILRPERKIDPIFLAYAAGSVSAQAQKSLMGKGFTVIHVYGDSLRNLLIAAPPEREQEQIGAAIERETARIDALIAKKTEFIELLTKKRQALITHAVTKGLNSKAKMKDSGVEWIGEVPEHWGVRSIKGIVSTPITDGPHETPQFYEEGIPFVSAEAISGGFLNFEKIRGHISKEAHETYSRKYKPRRNDIFMIKSGATTGVTAIVDTDIEFNIWSPLAVVRCGASMLPFFVLNYMRSHSFQEGVSQNWSFGTQQNIGMGVIGDLQIPVPSLNEQQSIAAYLKTGLGRLDSLVEKTQLSIDLLKKRRSALITAAVTGQIDLRESV